MFNQIADFAHNLFNFQCWLTPLPTGRIPVACTGWQSVREDLPYGPCSACKSILRAKTRVFGMVPPGDPIPGCLGFLFGRNRPDFRTSVLAKIRRKRLFARCIMFAHVASCCLKHPSNCSQTVARIGVGRGRSGWWSWQNCSQTVAKKEKRHLGEHPKCLF